MVTRILNNFFGGGKKSKAAGAASQKRKHPRRKAFNLIKFTTSDGTKYESLSNIVNISETGLRFTCYESLQPNSILHMRIHIPKTDKEVGLVAKLVWIRKMKRARGVYVAGVNFVEITDHDRHTIRKMVEQSAEAG